MQIIILGVKKSKFSWFNHNYIDKWQSCQKENNPRLPSIIIRLWQHWLISRLTVLFLKQRINIGVHLHLHLQGNGYKEACLWEPISNFAPIPIKIWFKGIHWFWWYHILRKFVPSINNPVAEEIHCVLRGGGATWQGGQAPPKIG